MNNILLAIGITLIICFFGLLIVPNYMDWSAYKQDIIITASEDYNLDLEIKGDIAVQLLPSPVVKARSVNLHHNNNRQVSAQIAEVEIELKPFDLILGALEPQYINLFGPVFRFQGALEQNAEDLFSIITKTELEEINKNSAIGLNISDGRIAWQEKVGHQPKHIFDINAKGEYSTLKSNLSLNGTASITSGPASYNISLSQLPTNSVEMRSSLDLINQNMRVTYKGLVYKPKTGFEIEGEILAEYKSSPQLKTEQQGELVNWTAGSDIKKNDQQYVFSNLTVNFKDDDFVLTGRGDWDFEGEGKLTTFLNLAKYEDISENNALIQQVFEKFSTSVHNPISLFTHNQQHTLLVNNAQFGNISTSDLVLDIKGEGDQFFLEKISGKLARRDRFEIYKNSEQQKSDEDLQLNFNTDSSNAKRLLKSILPAHVHETMLSSIVVNPKLDAKGYLKFNREEKRFIGSEFKINNDFSSSDMIVKIDRQNDQTHIEIEGGSIEIIDRSIISTIPLNIATIVNDIDSAGNVSVSYRSPVKFKDYESIYNAEALFATTQNAVKKTSFKLSNALGFELLTHFDLHSEGDTIDYTLPKGKIVASHKDDIKLIMGFLPEKLENEITYWLSKQLRARVDKDALEVDFNTVKTEGNISYINFDGFVNQYPISGSIPLPSSETSSNKKLGNWEISTFAENLSQHLTSANSINFLNLTSPSEIELRTNNKGEIVLSAVSKDYILEMVKIDNAKYKAILYIPNLKRLFKINDYLLINDGVENSFEAEIAFILSIEDEGFVFEEIVGKFFNKQVEGEMFWPQNPNRPILIDINTPQIIDIKKLIETVMGIDIMVLNSDKVTTALKAQKAFPKDMLVNITSNQAYYLEKTLENISTQLKFTGSNKSINIKKTPSQSEGDSLDIEVADLDNSVNLIVKYDLSDVATLDHFTKSLAVFNGQILMLNINANHFIQLQKSNDVKIKHDGQYHVTLDELKIKNFSFAAVEKLAKILIEDTQKNADSLLLSDQVLTEKFDQLAQNENITLENLPLKGLVNNDNINFKSDELILDKIKTTLEVEGNEKEISGKISFIFPSLTTQSKLSAALDIHFKKIGDQYMKRYNFEPFRNYILAKQVELKIAQIPPKKISIKKIKIPNTKRAQTIVKKIPLKPEQSKSIPAKKAQDNSMIILRKALEDVY